MTNIKFTIPFNDFLLQSANQKKSYLNACNRVINSGWYILGQEVEKFETEFANFLKVKHCIGVANGLEALQISLMALNIGPGDEVITTPMSAVATTLAIMAVGAKPIFVDIDKRGSINSDQIESVVTGKTKAILPVHLYGHAADLGKIMRICRKHHLFLIEDAAQAHGSTYRNKPLGSFGQLGCFSFYPTKNLGGIGDGGAIVTNDAKLAARCQMIRNYGQSSKYIHQVYGLNSRLDELQAALLRVKLKKLALNNKKRHQVAMRYARFLPAIKQVRMINEPSETVGNFHLLVIVAQRRDQLQQYLQAKGVESLVHYPLSIPDQPLFHKQYHNLKLPQTRQFAQSVLSLPCYPAVSLSQVKKVCQLITEFYL